jgi:hypothetical protein
MHIINILIITIVMKIRPTWILCRPTPDATVEAVVAQELAGCYKSTAYLFVQEAVEKGNALGTAVMRWRCSLAALPSPPYDNQSGT